MSAIDRALATLQDERAGAVLRRLHRAAGRQNVTLVGRLAAQLPRMLRGRTLPWEKLEPRMADLALAVDPANGVLCYLLARMLQARRIVEFGTSFGISTIYLALAVRDNGGGRVIATEMVPEKAARARAHWREAGLEEWIELREGDALHTLRELDEPVDMLMNDGFPRFTLPVLQLVAPRMRIGAPALCGNAAVFPADHADYVAWVRDPANGFRSAKLAMTLAGELSVKVR